MAWWHSYNSAVTFALQMPKYRTKAKEIAREKGIWDELKRRKLSKVIPYSIKYMFACVLVDFSVLIIRRISGLWKMQFLEQL